MVDNLLLLLTSRSHIINLPLFKNFVNTVVFLIIIIIIIIIIPVIIIIIILKFLNNSGTLYFKSSSNKVYKYKTILTVDIEIKVQIIDYGTIIMIIFLPCQDYVIQTMHPLFMY